MSIRVLLASEEGPARQAYLRALAELDVQADVVASPREIRERILGAVYRGLVVDMHTLMRDRSYDKRELFRLEERFPVIRVRHDPATGEIAGLARGESFTGKAALHQFINSQCRDFRPGGRRAPGGVALSLAVLVCPRKNCPEDQCLKTVTMRISLADCSVFSADPAEEGTLVWLIFPDLQDQTPVPARVGWRVPWGEKRAAPGMGLAFASLTAGQAQEFVDMGLTGPQPPLAPDLQDV